MAVTADYGLALRYTLFASIAAASNLVVQRLVLRLLRFSDNTFTLNAAIIAGTSAGLIIKYLLDKKWIFFIEERSFAANGKLFSLYSLMGIFTTAIFWLTETLFWITFDSHKAREFGAILGLLFGYYIKYRLDRRYVFPTLIRPNNHSERNFPDDH